MNRLNRSVQKLIFKVIEYKLYCVIQHTHNTITILQSQLYTVTNDTAQFLGLS